MALSASLFLAPFVLKPRYHSPWRWPDTFLFDHGAIGSINLPDSATIEHFQHIDLQIVSASLRTMFLIIVGHPTTPTFSDLDPDKSCIFCLEILQPEAGQAVATSEETCETSNHNRKPADHLPVQQSGPPDSRYWAPETCKHSMCNDN